jgi:hypothetical protein
MAATAYYDMALTAKFSLTARSTLVMSDMASGNLWCVRYLGAYVFCSVRLVFVFHWRWPDLQGLNRGTSRTWLGMVLLLSYPPLLVGGGRNGVPASLVTAFG